MTASAPTFRPALASRRFHQLSPDAIFELSAEFQVSGIEWSEFHSPCCQLDRAANLAEATRSSGLTVAGYSSTWPSNHIAFSHVVGVAVALGAPTIRVGATGIVSVWGSDESLSDLRASLDAAYAAGISVSFAYLPAAYHSTVAFIRKTGHPAARLYLRSPRTLEEHCLPARYCGLPFYVPDVEVLGSLAGKAETGFSVPGSRVRSSSFASSPTAVFETGPRDMRLGRAIGRARPTGG